MDVGEYKTICKIMYKKKYMQLKLVSLSPCSKKPTGMIGQVMNDKDSVCKLVILYHQALQHKV